MKDEFVKIYVRAFSLYEATVAVEYHVQELCKQGVRPILWEPRGRENTIDLKYADYQNAVQNGLVPAKVSRKQQEEFLQRPRDFRLWQQKIKRRGLFGLGKCEYRYQVLATDTCAACGGTLIWMWRPGNCGLPSQKICKNCDAPARVLEKEPPLQDHQYGNQVVEDGCKRKRVCCGCGHEKMMDSVHTYNISGYRDENGKKPDWEYLKVDSCVQVRKCLLCGETESRTEHAGKWLPKSSTSTVENGKLVCIWVTETCSRCGEDRSYDCLDEQW